VGVGVVDGDALGVGVGAGLAEGDGEAVGSGEAVAVGAAAAAAKGASVGALAFGVPPKFRAGSAIPWRNASNVFAREVTRQSFVASSPDT
jgi:hypothetical protein